jgi:WD40 repeat protein
VWDAQQHPPLVRTLLVSQHRISQTAISPDGQHVAAVFVSVRGPGEGGMTTRMEVKVWQADTGKELFSLKTPGSHQFEALVFSPDGRRLAAAENEVKGSTHVVKLWDIATGSEVLTLRPTGKITQLAFSADGHRLWGLLLYATPRGDLVQVWDATPFKGGE